MSKSKLKTAEQVINSIHTDDVEDKVQSMSREIKRLTQIISVLSSEYNTLVRKLSRPQAGKKLKKVSEVKATAKSKKAPEVKQTSSIAAKLQKSISGK